MSEIAGLFEESREVDVKRQIVSELLSDENLDRKTELTIPLRWSCLKMIADTLERNELKRSALLLNNFITTSMKYLVSKGRKGRTEYIEALRALGAMDRAEPPPIKG